MTGKHWTIDDIADQTGRVAVVTGANSGLGLETARVLAGAGATTVLAIRNVEKGEAAAESIRAIHPGADVVIQNLDLASLDSIRAAAEQVGDRFERIDLLINNAGVMYTPRQKTADGFEMQMGTNHLGHFAWTGLLLDRMMQVDAARIVVVSSIAHRVMSRIDFADLQCERRYNRVAAYGRSKLANLLFAYELQRRLEGADSGPAVIAAHPGVSDTELARHIPGAALIRPMLKPMTQSANMGALPTLRAATDLGAKGGEFYGPDGFMEYRGHPVIVTSNDRSHDPATQQELWTASEELTGITYPT